MRISLGSDCSIAYNLQRLNYKKESFPFDWILTKNLAVLEDNFLDFLNIDFLTVKNKVNFCKIDEVFTDVKENMLRIKNIKYNLYFLHDFTSLEDINIVKEKYDRRINRFFKIMQDENIEKRLYRISKYDEREYIEKILSKFKNWKLYIKLYSELPSCKDWKREEFDWESWFI